MGEEETVPSILRAAWSVCTPEDDPLEVQLAPLERKFLIKLAGMIVQETETSGNKPGQHEISFEEKEHRIQRILNFANVKLAVLVRQVSPALTHAVLATVLYLLESILTCEHFKYKTMEEMLAVYPSFEHRSEEDRRTLFLTANWMAVLFRVIPARKNKGVAMDIVPKFVEGNAAHYVTGGGQSSATTDRVHIYETEGGCKAKKRVRKNVKYTVEDIDDVKLPVLSLSSLPVSSNLISGPTIKDLFPFTVPNQYLLQRNAYGHQGGSHDPPAVVSPRYRNQQARFHMPLDSSSGAASAKNTKGDPCQPQPQPQPQPHPISSPLQRLKDVVRTNEFLYPPAGGPLSPNIIPSTNAAVSHDDSGDTNIPPGYVPPEDFSVSECCDDDTDMDFSNIFADEEDHRNERMTENKYDD